MLPTTVVRGQANPLHWKFPARLRSARRAANLSADGLSRAAGVSKSAVSSLEASTRIPRLPTVELLANVLQISPGWLAFGIESPWEVFASDGLRCSGLAVRAQQARAACGLSRTEVGRRAGNVEGAIRAVESGTMPTLDTLEALAKALSVSPAWLAFGVDSMSVSKRRGSGPAPASPSAQPSPAIGPGKRVSSHT